MRNTTFRVFAWPRRWRPAVVRTGLSALVALAAFSLASALVLESPALAAPKRSDGKHKKPPSKKKKAAARSLEDDFPRSPREKLFVKSLGETYKLKRTAHFFILYDAEEDITKSFIPRLERTYDMVARFVTQMEIKVKIPNEKLPVLFCGAFDEYAKRCVQLAHASPPSEAAGLYWHGPNFSIFYDVSQNPDFKETGDKVKQLTASLKQATDRQQRQQILREKNWYQNQLSRLQQDFNRSIVQHELAHELLFNFGFHDHPQPQWFVEGVATLFEPPPTRSGAGFNVINQNRLQNLREQLGTVASAPGDALRGAPTRGRGGPAPLTPDELKSFIANPAGGAQMLSLDGYARSWGLCYYLVKRKSKQLKAYVNQPARGKSAAPPSGEEQLAEFEKHFGKVDQVFTKKWVHFITNLPFKPPS